MYSEHLEYLATLRIVIGFLGEREQFAWWQSSFFSAGSEAFLSPIFARTRFLAQCTGVVQAASAIHDARIGTGNVYHLFRLPEDMTQDIHQHLQASDTIQEIARTISDKATALNFLRQDTLSDLTTSSGPMRIDQTGTLRDLSRWRTVSAHYANAFDQGIEIFPYFSDIA